MLVGTLVLFVLLPALTEASASNGAVRVHRLSPDRTTQNALVFNVTGVRSLRVRAARLKRGSKTRRLHADSVSRAARRGVMRVRVPRSWSQRSRASGRIKRPRLVIVTGSSQGSEAGRPDVPPGSLSRGTAPAIPITGRTFYVSPSGSDGNDGLSPAAAWRSVARVNRASLAPGDGVLFAGGASFSDQTLMPSRSGASGAHVVYGSYGGAKASLTKGVWFTDTSWLAFQDLSITGPSQGITASGSGAGASKIVVQNSRIANVSTAIQAPNKADKGWLLRSNVIENTRDSGIILLGDGHTVADSTIVRTGTDSSISYGKHGIYLKSSNSRVAGNTIRDFSSEGVSTRLPNTLVEGNEISNGGHGIGWYQNDSRAGTSHWRNNTITNTTAACLWVSPSDSHGSTRESFVITGNSLNKASGKYTDLRATSGRYTVSGNVER